MTSDGSRAAFVDRLDRHRAILFKVANAYCRNPADREDLVQETIVQLWRAYPRFDCRQRFSTWTYRIAMNVAISFYRRETRNSRNVASRGDALLEMVPAALEPEPDERLAALRELIEQLDPLNRAVMILYLDDYPHAEIATILGISETNVATARDLGRRRLPGRLSRLAAEQRAFRPRGHPTCGIRRKALRSAVRALQRDATARGRHRGKQPD